MRLFAMMENGEPVHVVEGLSDRYRLVYRQTMQAFGFDAREQSVAGFKVGVVDSVTGLYSVSFLGVPPSRLRVGTADEVGLTPSPYELVA